TGAQLNAAQVRPTAQDTGSRNADARAVRRVNVAIVSLEQTQTETVIEEWQIIIHAAADCQRRAPAIRLMLKRRRNIAVRSTQSPAANQAVSKQCEVLHRSAEDRTRGHVVEAVVLAVRMETRNNLATHVLIKVIGSAQHRALVDRRVADVRRLDL